VTSIVAGSGLNGGTITSTGTISVNSGSMLPYYSSSIFSRVSGDITINSATGVATIAANSVALGTDTTGNYASAVTAGDGVTVGGSAGEGTSFSVAVNTGSVHFLDGVKKELNTEGVISSSAQQVVSSYTNATDDRVITSTGAGGINGEANLRFNGSLLTVASSVSASSFTGSLSGSNATLGALTMNGTVAITGSIYLRTAIEHVVGTSSAPPATLNYNVLDGAILFHSGSTTANWTLNFRGNASTTLNSIMPVSSSTTVTLLVRNAATRYSSSAYQIDGSSIIPRWQNGASGSATANSIDAHTFTIVKISSTPTYLLLGSITRYS
jgi:hypothetical protein